MLLIKGVGRSFVMPKVAEISETAFGLSVLGAPTGVTMPAFTTNSAGYPIPLTTPAYISTSPGGPTPLTTPVFVVSGELEVSS